MYANQWPQESFKVQAMACKQNGFYDFREGFIPEVRPTYYNI